MLVVGVGLMAVFALFPAGADANRKAIQDTQIGHFAEYVLNGFRFEAESISWSQVANTPGFSISPIASDYVWDKPPIITAGSGIKKAEYFVLNNPEIAEMGFRYEFEVFPIAGRPKMKAFVLKVWQGALLTAPAAPEDATVFYTEVYNYGG